MPHAELAPLSEGQTDPMRDPPPLPAARPRPLRRRTALLLSPFYPKDPHASFGKHVLTPSLALTSLAGATPPGWEVSFWDENLLQGAAPHVHAPEVVGITVHLTSAERAYALARAYRAMGSKVVLGGLHVLSCPDEVAPHADAIAIGNGVRTWPQILADVARGSLAPRYSAPFDDYAHEPPPDRSILPSHGFLTPASLIATQGCHNRCDFCYLATGRERIRYQMRRPADVARDFASTGAPYGVFVDNNLGSSRRYLRELCTELAPLRKIWSGAVTIDVTDDEELVREMALAGCTGVFVGFESLTDRNLLSAGKKTPRSADYARRVRIFHRHGIQVNGSFVVGFDHDGPECFDRIVDWVEENRLECATYHILTPYPGTPLFARMKSEGRLLHERWSLYDTSHCVFRPARMSPAVLEAGYARMYGRTFSPASIWRRRPTDAAAVPAYLAMAWLYKRSNPLWSFLIRRRLTHAAWAPLVEATRLRHLVHRRRLAGREAIAPLAQPMRAGV